LNPKVDSEWCSLGRAARNWVRFVKTPGISRRRSLKDLGVSYAFIAVQGCQPLQALGIVAVDVDVGKQGGAGGANPRDGDQGGSPNSVSNLFVSFSTRVLDIDSSPLGASAFGRDR